MQLGYPASDLSVRHTEEYLNHRVGEGIQARTAYEELSTLRTAWRWTVKAKMHNEPLAMPDIKLPRRLRRARPFNRESAWEVYDDIGTNGPEWAVRAYLLGLLMGGPRTGETCAIRVQDIDLVGRSIRVPNIPGLTKTGAREVKISEASAAALAPHVLGRNPGERFIGNQSPSYVKSAIGGIIRRSCRNPGIVEFTYYGLRHHSIDEYARAGVAPEVAAAQSGNSAEVIQRHYRQVRPDEQAKAAASVDFGTRPQSRKSADVRDIRAGRKPA